MYHTHRTIAAIASAPSGAARGIVRISGPSVLSILEACFCPASNQALAAIRTARMIPGTITLSDSTVKYLPADLYWWSNNRSYTRQAAAEIHAIGSPPLVSAILKTVCKAGAHVAAPGEFTLRAFLAGRIDLTQAEAVLSVIDAHGQREFSAALSQLAGGLSAPLEHARETLLNLLAQLEAGLDFVEDDIQFINAEQIETDLADALGIVNRLNQQMNARQRSDVMPRAVLAGWPNVGKSSLFNALSENTNALVSRQAGTTRDYLVATITLDGICCQLVDTAGREPHGEQGSIAGHADRIASEQADDAQVRLLCLDATRTLNDWEQQELQANHDPQQLVLLTKCDDSRRTQVVPGAIETSARTGQGIDKLRQTLRQAIARISQGDSAASVTVERCAESLRNAQDVLTSAAAANHIGGGEELIAHEVRAALDALGQVAGTVYTDDILDRIFSRFCIGK